MTPVTPVTQTDPNFAFAGQQHTQGPGQAPPPAPADPLGPLEQLEGTWTGEGFNTIWRPNTLTSGQDRFLELNMTTETLVFTKINGAIPNRGLLMPDIDMFGLTYMQQIAQKDDGAGLHIEPGIWVNVPQTSNPAEGPTVVRMASIPHGTVILAQGNAFVVAGGPHIADNNIIPFKIGTPPPPNSDFDAAAGGFFKELNLSVATQFRFVSNGVTQDMVRNPNSVLDAAIAGQNITSTTVLVISSTHTPVPGGGTANTAFLEDGSNPPGGNADAVEVDAIFWIETVSDGNGGQEYLQLQYTQLVQLDFNGLRWPHVTVATLRKDGNGHGGNDGNVQGGGGNGGDGGQGGN
jgi:hypothetical protein